jgi:HD-GYP domain-containing protein (c-di-GMP phosphodiesterase class II)
MAQLIDLMDAKNPRAAAEVTAVAEMMGQFLDLPAWQIQRLRLASLLHRMGPLQSTDSVFTASKPDDYTQDQAPSCPLTCSLATGAQTLRTMPRLRAIAQIITHQTEWWNGFGQPAGLAGDDIPLESRILGLVADFQQRAASLQMPHSADDTLLTHWQNQLAAALAKCQAEQGDRWDPKLVEVLALIVSGLQQGIHLPTKLPKFTNGIWLLEPVEETFDQALKLPLLELEGSTPAYMMEEVREY